MLGIIVDGWVTDIIKEKNNKGNKSKKDYTGMYIKWWKSID